MTPRLRRAARACVLTLATTALVGGGLAPTASYADGETEAPVAVDDTFTWFTGGSTTLPVLRNDTDPQGATLEVCKVKSDPGDYSIGGAQLLDGEVYAYTSPQPAGPLVFRYYACNDEFLTPATVTVSFKTARQVRVHKVQGRPGYISVRNPNDQRVVFIYGNQNFYGFKRVAAHGSRELPVPVHDFRWIAAIGREGGNAGAGRVHDLDSPETAVAPRAHVPARIQHLWVARG